MNDEKKTTMPAVADAHGHRIMDAAAKIIEDRLAVRLLSLSCSSSDGGQVVRLEVDMGRA